MLTPAAAMVEIVETMEMVDTVAAVVVEVAAPAVRVESPPTGTNETNSKSSSRAGSERQSQLRNASILRTSG